MNEFALDSAIWFGRSGERTRQSLAVGFLAFGVILALHTPALGRVLQPLGVPGGFGVNGPILWAIGWVLATGAAYTNDGLVVCLALVAAPIIGFVAATVDFGLFASSSGVYYPGVAALILVPTVVFGVLGFVTGISLRWIVGAIRDGLSTGDDTGSQK